MCISPRGLYSEGLTIGVFLCVSNMGDLYSEMLIYGTANFWNFMVFSYFHHFFIFFLNFLIVKILYNFAKEVNVLVNKEMSNKFSKFS